MVVVDPRIVVLELEDVVVVLTVVVVWHDKVSWSSDSQSPWILQQAK